MNKKILVIAVIFLILLVGTGAFFLFKPTPKNQPEVKQNQTGSPAVQNNTENKTEAIKATLKDLLSAGKSTKCTFSTNTENTSVSGTVYAGNGKVREDFQSNAAGSTMSGHLIVDSTSSYMWTEGSVQGFKFDVSQVPTGSSSQSQAQDINKSMNFSCQGWSADNSLFTLPANVTFQSFTVPVLSPKAGSSTENTNQSACAACDNIPAGEARNACRTQLNCK